MIRQRFLHHGLGLLACSVLLAVDARAQAPPAAMPAAAAFDAARGTLVVVGEVPGGAATWLWDGTTWRHYDGPGPDSREEPAMAYDAARRRVVVFGGRSDGVGDTWEWDGVQWQRVASEGPPGRTSAAMVYDSVRQRVLLFGGSRPDRSVRNDLWAWDGRTWQELVADGAASSPPARVLHGMAYDPVRDRVVVAGGVTFRDDKPVVFGDTWEWDGTAWQRADVSGPSPRDHVWMTWDPSRRQVLLHGGGHPDIGIMGDTWSFDGTRWTLVTNDGPKRARHRLEWDSARNAVVLYGGWQEGGRTNELWYLRGDVWTRVELQP